MLLGVGRACFGARGKAGVLTVLASGLLLSSCGTFDFFGAGDKTAAVETPPPAPVVAEAPKPDTTVWPTHGWQTASPEAEGLDSQVLAAALDTIRARHIPVNSVLIERHGKIVLDAYFNPYTEDELHNVFSVTKSVTSTLVGIAMADGKLNRLDVSVEGLLPDVKADGDPRKEHITLANLLSMTSGLDCSDANGRNYLQQMEGSRHWANFALARPETAEPGSTFNYCAGNMHLVSAVLTRATGESAADYAREKLFAPLGIDDASWPKDGDGIAHGFADLKLSPRDMAKLGYLWLHRGQWEGKQVVPASYLADAFTAHANVEPNVQYGYGMWIYPEHGHAGGPADVEANGAGGQRIAVVPSQDMVEVITGTNLDANAVSALLADAVKSDSALPENPIEYARLETRVAEVETGTHFAIATVAPKPKPQFGTETADVSAPMLTAALLASLPKPRPNS